MIRLRTSLLPILSCLLVAELPLTAQSATHLTLGVYSFKKPTDVARDFAAATTELSRLLTKEMGAPFEVNLRVFKTYDECLDKFVAGEVDVVRFGPASYVLAKQRNDKVQLLVAEQEDGQKRCEGVIAVRNDSPIQRLEDLKGHTFAFGDENSTIGRYLSQAELVKNGVRREDLKDCKYLERHDKVFKAVEVGDFDAGAMHIATFQDLNEKKQLRTIAIFKNVGKPWVARAGLDAQLVAGLRRALCAMTNPEPLNALKVHGFQEATEGDFTIVREAMKTAERFENPKPKSDAATKPEPQAKPEAQPKPGKV